MTYTASSHFLPIRKLHKLPMYNLESFAPNSIPGNIISLAAVKNCKNTQLCKVTVRSPAITLLSLRLPWEACDVCDVSNVLSQAQVEHPFKQLIIVL